MDELTDAQVQELKNTIDGVDVDVEQHQLIVESTNYNTFVRQYFEYKPEVEYSGDDYYLNIRVYSDGLALTSEGEDLGAASHEAYQAAREYAKNNIKSLIDTFPTVNQ